MIHMSLLHITQAFGCLHAGIGLDGQQSSWTFTSRSQRPVLHGWLNISYTTMAFIDSFKPLQYWYGMSAVLVDKHSNLMSATSYTQQSDDYELACKRCTTLNELFEDNLTNPHSEHLKP